MSGAAKRALAVFLVVFAWTWAGFCYFTFPSAEAKPVQVAAPIPPHRVSKARKTEPHPSCSGDFWWSHQESRCLWANGDEPELTCDEFAEDATGDPQLIFTVMLPDGTSHEVARFDSDDMRGWLSDEQRDACETELGEIEDALLYDAEKADREGPGNP